MTAVLETENLVKRFGELSAVDMVSLSVQEHAIHSIIGPNGAGKSTLFNLITSLHYPDEGRGYLEGEDITNQSPFEIARRGVVRSFQITDIFGNLTVLENVRLAAQADDSSRASLLNRVDDADDATTRAREVLDTLGLVEQAAVPASDLSHGDRRRLELGLAIATDPTVILLDEPTAGMGSEETEETVQLIHNLALDEGVTVLLIEHDIDFVMNISDTISVLHKGTIIAEGDPETIRENQAVLEAYLGAAEL